MKTKRINKVDIKNLDIIMKTISEIFSDSDEDINIIFRKNIDGIDINTMAFFNSDKLAVVKLDNCSFEQNFINIAKKYYYRISTKDINIIKKYSKDINIIKKHSIDSMYIDKKNDNIMLCNENGTIDAIIIFDKVEKEIVKQMMIENSYYNYNINIKNIVDIEKNSKYLYTETLGDKSVLYDVYLYKQKIIRVKDFNRDENIKIPVKIYYIDIKKYVDLDNDYKNKRWTRYE